MYHDSSLACILAKWLSDTASYLKPILNTFFKLEIRFRYINQNFYNHFISTFCGFQDRIFINIKLPGPIFYQILCMYLNDGFAKNVYNNSLCSFSGQLSHISLRKCHVILNVILCQVCLQNKLDIKGTKLFLLIIIWSTLKWVWLN